MPELPEVETVKNQLAQELVDQPVVEVTKKLRADLRFPFPSPMQLNQLKGKKIAGLFRRAKYILFDFEDVLLLSHLGMTGNWRVSPSLDLEKHDHFVIQVTGTKGRRFLIYEDPRRFGFIDILHSKDLRQSKWFQHLGPEPWDSKKFTAEYLKSKGSKSQRPIKNFLMDQEVVVGVGNIYASEALFLAKIKPQKKADRLSAQDWQRLAKVIPKVLKDAVKFGGTTLRDYKNLEGKSGENQLRLRVYGREGEACMKCKGKIRRKVMAGRSTFWCGECQH